MAHEVVYHSPASVPTWSVFLDTVRQGTASWTHRAELGDVGTSTFVLEDPTGTAGRNSDHIVGHKTILANENALSVSTRNIYAGFVGQRTYKRSAEEGLLTAAATEITVTCQDINAQAGFAILHDGEGDRPSETPAARLTWLLTGIHSFFRVVDLGLVVYPTTPTMDANNYDGQTAADVLADLALKVGYNWFIYWDPSAQRAALFFDDSNTSTAYTSNVRISNVLADKNSDHTVTAAGSNTYFPSIDGELTRDPTRVFSGVYEPWDGGATYAQNAATGSNFAFRDGPAPTASVKSSTAALSLANRLLDDASSEADVIATTIHVLNTAVNDVRAGQRLQVKFTHLPGYEDWRWCRVLTRTVHQQIDSQNYLIDLVLSPQCLSISVVHSNVTTNASDTFYQDFGWTATAGNLLLFIGARRDGGPILQSADWTWVTGGYEPSAPALGDDSLSAVYKIADGSETRVKAWQSGGSTKIQGWIFEFQGADTVTSTTILHSSGASLSTNSVTPPEGDAFVIGAWAVSQDLGFSPVVDQVLPYILDFGTSDGFHPNFGVVHRVVSSVAGYTPVATVHFSFASTGWSGWALAVTGSGSACR